MTDLRINQFEIPSQNPETLSQFYRHLFGWDIERVPVPGFDYWHCKTGSGPGINGAITRPLFPQQTVTNYATVPDVDALINKAISLGAKVVVGKAPVPGMGWYTILQDPEGNPLGFWQNDKQAC